MHGYEQEVTLGARSVLLYPLYHPAAALYTPSMLKVLEEDFARIPALARAPRSTSRRATRHPPTGSEPDPAAESSSACSDVRIELASASAARPSGSQPALAERLGSGDVVAVSGELGSG